MDKRYITTSIKRKEFPPINGLILDVGCGGIGAISRVYDKNNVIGIDKLQEELYEGPMNFQKFLFDYSEKNFHENFFDAVTMYFSIMYMMKYGEKEKVFANALKDLKPNGKIYIWDIEIKKAYPEPYGIVVKSDLVRDPTYYGVKCPNFAQTRKGTVKLLEECGFKNIKVKKKRNYFYIEAQKC